MEVIIKTNQFQTPITKELLDKYPLEVQEEFMDLVQNVPFIKNLISKDRPWVKDLPKDNKGRAIIDLSNPPLYDNVDYFRQTAKFFEKNKCYTFLKPNSNPNSEYRKFWDREIDRCYNGMLREDGMWISGQMYWNLNYCPMLVNIPVPGSNKAIRKESLPWFFEGIWWRFLYLDMARENGHHAIELAKRGAHPYTQKVLTPQGEKLWGDIKVGDELFSTYGTITKVIDIPVDKEYDYVYELTLQDGRTVLATYDHLFNLYINSPKFLKLFSYKVCYDCITIDLLLNHIKEDISLWLPTAYRFIRGKRRTVSKYMKIIKCTKIEGKQRCKCVTVDSKDHCYLIGDNVPTHNCGKSYTLASIMTHNLILGESEETKKRNITVLTAYLKEYLAGDKDGTLSKFKPELPFIAENTPFPRLYLKQSSDNMTWQMGYKDSYGREKGSFNLVMAVSAKDDSDKLRGKRGYILFEEFGNFPNLLELYDVTRKSTEDGGYTFSLMFMIGTANNKESNFESAKTLLYAPDSYNIQSIPNLYDKKGLGKERFGFFFGAPINRLGCFNKDGVSDVVKALLLILMQRYKAKHGADPSSVLRVIAEDPITPAEAIIKVRTSYFPTVALGERANELDTNPNSYDRVLIGSLAFKNGAASFIPTSDTPIRKYPVPNDEKGALEIYNLPEEDSKGKVFENRYILGCLPPGEKVMTDKGLKPIEQVSFEDKLVSKDGQYVSIILKKSYYVENEPLYRIKINGVIDSTAFTKEHPIYACTYNSSETNNNSNAPYAYKEFDFKFKKAEDLKVGDYVKIPNIYKKSLPIPYSKWKKERRILNPMDLEDFWWMVGLILGNGQCSNNGYSIYVNFNIKESKTINRFKHIVNRLFNRRYILNKEHKTYVEYSFCYKAFNLFIQKYFNLTAYNKSLPLWVKYLPFNLKGALLKGYIDSNGYINNNSIEVVSLSKKILNDFQDILYSLEISSYVDKLRNSKTNNQVTFYRLRISGQWVRKLISIVGNDCKLDLNKVQDYRTANECIFDGNYILKRIDSIESSLYTGVVYNFHCESNTFMCNYIPTHNCDPADNDLADSSSLMSVFVFDLFTDTIVAEYTGRQLFADLGYEIVRLLCLFYNAKCLYESNIKGCFAYFEKMHSTHLLADTPQYLRDMQMIKYNNFGSNSKGVRMSHALIDYGNRLLRDWLNTPRETVTKDEDGNVITATLPALYSLYNRALIEELIQYNPVINTDRVAAMRMIMLYRQQELIRYLGDFSNITNEKAYNDDPSLDEFFTDNFDSRFDN